MKERMRNKRELCFPIEISVLILSIVLIIFSIVISPYFILPLYVRKIIAVIPATSMTFLLWIFLDSKITNTLSNKNNTKFLEFWNTRPLMVDWNKMIVYLRW